MPEIEGIIKFNIQEWKKNNKVNNSLWQEIENNRIKLYEKKLVGFDEKTNLGFGNISIRIPESNQFIITGSQTGNYKVLNEKQYCIITNTNLENYSVSCEGPIKPSSESVTHAACYHANTKINAVVHVHSNILWNKLIDKNYPSTPKEAQYGSKLLSESIRELCKNLNKDKSVIIVMKGHEDGIIIAGNSLDKITNEIIKHLSFSQK